jgi:hypothetical protein
MKQISLNNFPHAERCINCEFAMKTDTLKNSIFDNSLICLINHDAETCLLPDLKSTVNKVQKVLPTMDFRAALRARRKAAAKTNCLECKGTGEIINILTREQNACPCTK